MFVVFTRVDRWPDREGIAASWSRKHPQPRRCWRDADSAARLSPIPSGTRGTQPLGSHATGSAAVGPSIDGWATSG